MAKDDYHVIAYQILAYLYQRLKKGEEVDPSALRSNGGLIRANERYWAYRFLKEAKEITPFTLD